MRFFLRMSVVRLRRSLEFLLSCCARSRFILSARAPSEALKSSSEDCFGTKFLLFLDSSSSEIVKLWASSGPQHGFRALKNRKKHLSSSALELRESLRFFERDLVLSCLKSLILALVRTRAVFFYFCLPPRWGPGEASVSILWASRPQICVSRRHGN